MKVTGKTTNMRDLAMFAAVYLLVFLAAMPPEIALADTSNSVTAAPVPPLDPVEKELAPDVYIQIVPRMELLAGVQTQTTWMNISGPKGKGPTYFRELKAFFDPYSEHEAVRLSQELLGAGFNGDAPPHFVLRLGPLPELEKVRPYGDYLEARGQGEQTLDEFRVALRDLASESGFADFFAEHRDDYEQWVRETSEGFDAARVINWLRDFYGWQGGVYYVVLAPAMFPGGGYGASYELEDGRMAIFQVVREAGESETQPEFPTGEDLEYLTLHEWGHSFVNPTLEQFPDKVQRLAPLFIPVAGRMADQSYPSLPIFMNEQVLRATTALAERDLNGEQAYQKALAEEESRGFYLTGHIVGLLEYYRARRDEYPTFREFAPYMLDQLAAEAPELARTYRDAQIRKWVPLAVLLVVVGGVGLQRLRRRRSRPSPTHESQDGSDHESQPEPGHESQPEPEHE